MTMDANELRALADALPEGVHWSDPITPDMLAEAIRRFCADAQPVPAGWKLVPVEPTPEMLSAVGMMDGYDWHAPGCSPDADHANWYSAMIAAAPAAPQAERDELRDLLLRAGFVQCDIPACNCGSWHHRYGLPERMQEIRDALAEAGHELSNANGNLTLNALKELVAERDALKADAERYRWLRGDLCPDHSVRWTQWEVRCWKAPSWTGDLRRADLDDAIDAAIDAARGRA